MTEVAPPSAPKIDTSVPHSARIWNYWLGGKDNYPVDREAGDKYRELYPQIADTARAARYFMPAWCATSRAKRASASSAMLAPGSYLALVDSVSTGRAHREAAQRYAQTGTVLYQRRGPEQIKGFFAWVTLIDHGAVPVSDWRPDPSPFPPALAGTLGGVGRKAAG